MMNRGIEHIIEAYLSGNLSAEELNLFEKEMSANPALAKDVELSRAINLHVKGKPFESSFSENEYTNLLDKFLASEEASKIQQNLRDANKKYAPQKMSTRKKRSFYWVAAIISILICSSLFFLLKPTNAEKLYAQYFVEDDLPSVFQRGDKENKLTEGVELFHDGDYENAIYNFEKYIAETEEINPYVYIYKGVSHTEKGEYKLAMQDFDLIINSDFIDSSKGLWFKALCFLRNKDIENSTIILKTIIKDPTNYKYQEALELLRKI